MSNDSIKEWLADIDFGNARPSEIRARAVVHDVDHNADRNDDGSLRLFPETWSMGCVYYKTPTRGVGVGYYNGCVELLAEAEQNEINASDILRLKAVEFGGDVDLNMRKIEHGCYEAAKRMGFDGDPGLFSLLINATIKGFERAASEQVGFQVKASKGTREAIQTSLLNSYALSKDALRQARRRARKSGDDNA